MNSYPCPVEIQRRCSRITRSFYRGSNHGPHEEPRPIIQFEPPRENRPKTISVNVKTIKPPRRRSRCSYFTGKRKRRRSSIAESANFVIDTNPGPNSDEPSEPATSPETALDRVSGRHVNVHTNREFFEETESALMTIQTTRYGGKRSYSKLECEEPIVATKRRLIMCPQNEQNHIPSDEEQRNELVKSQRTLTETLSITIKQEASSPVLNHSFAFPLTPSDTDPCPSPRDNSLSPSHGTSIDSSKSTHFYEPITPSTASLHSDLDYQQPERVLKQESSESSPSEEHQPQNRYFSLPTHVSTHETRVKSENLPRNWLDVSKVLIRPELIVRAIRSDGAPKNNNSTKMLFNSLYRQFGKYRNEIVVVDGRNCLKILTNNQESRLKVKAELEEIFGWTNKSDVKLFVGLPDLRRPIIQFEFNRRINSFWMIDIKKENQWPHSSSVLFKRSSCMKNGQYLISIEVDSTIRGLIEQDDGTILIDRQKVHVFDGLGLAFCYNCSSYNRCSIMTCNNQNRCLYCGCNHNKECWYKNQPSRWFCFRCKVPGHSIISKDCPALLIKLRSRLAKIDHKYNYVFLEEYDLQRGNLRNGLARLF